MGQARQRKEVIQQIKQQAELAWWKEIYIVAYHEAAHVIAALASNTRIGEQGVSVTPLEYDNTISGYTDTRYEDRRWKDLSEDEQLDFMAGCLIGVFAEWYAREQPEIEKLQKHWIADFLHVLGVRGELGAQEHASGKLFLSPEKYDIALEAMRYCFVALIDPTNEALDVPAGNDPDGVTPKLRKAVERAYEILTKHQEQVKALAQAII